MTPMTVFHPSHDEFPQRRPFSRESRRRCERVPFYCEVRLTSQAERTTVTAHTCDLSLGGVKVAAPSALAPGSSVLLGFVMTDRRGHKVIEHVAGRVVRCDSDIDANYLGIEFAAPLGEEASPLLSRRLIEI